MSTFDADGNKNQETFEEYRERLLVRPAPVFFVDFPTVRNTQEAALICHDFSTVIGAGPRVEDCNWGHPNHKVWTFEDGEYPDGPSLMQVYEMLMFGVPADDVLVYCDSGTSGSTALAWAISIVRQAKPKKALEVLIQVQPMEGNKKRLFLPNEVLIIHMDYLLDRQDTFEIFLEHEAKDPEIRRLNGS